MPHRYFNGDHARSESGTVHLVLYTTSNVFAFACQPGLLRNQISGYRVVKPSDFTFDAVTCLGCIAEGA